MGLGQAPLYHGRGLGLCDGPRMLVLKDVAAAALSKGRRTQNPGIEQRFIRKVE